MAVTLYVIKGSASGKRYVGITTDLSRRLREHSRGESKAGQLLGPFVLLHTELFPDHASARRRERFLKSGQGKAADLTSLVVGSFRR
ncbi:MAG: GIY-YIG nuclease family protein [Armatimonadota bacterium]